MQGHNDSVKPEGAVQPGGQGEPIFTGGSEGNRQQATGHGAEPTDLEVIEVMIGLGGGFVRRLGEAWMRADGDNFARLKAAFPEYWLEYTSHARKLKARLLELKVGGVA